MTGNPINEVEASPFITRRHVVIASVVVLLFCTLAFAGYRWMRNDALATLVALKGETDRDIAAEIEKWFGANKGDRFSDGDGARTSPEASAHFRLKNGAKLLLKPGSQIRFRRRGGKKGAIGLSVEVGEVEVRTGDKTLSLDSQFGEIVIEANSLVTLKRDGDRLALSVELGRIELGASRRGVGAGETLSLEIGGIEVDKEKSNQGLEESQPDPSLQKIDEDLLLGDGVDRVDLVVSSGQSFVVHDPRPPTSIGFTTSAVCEGAARLSVGKLKTEVRSQGNLRLPVGTHHYQVHCLRNPEVVAASGKVVIVRDSGVRKLPSFTPSTSVALDGRRYTLLYQERFPQVTVSWPSAPELSSYTLKIGGRSIRTRSPRYTFSSLKRGTHRLTFSAASTPPRKSRTTTIVVKHDAQAPTARLSEPRSGYQDGSSVRVAGQALPGWTVSINGKAVEVDAQRRFLTEITPNGSLPIAFSHPTRGMHYYLRRSRSSPAH